MSRIKKSVFCLAVLIRHFFRQPGTMIPFVSILAAVFLLSLADLDTPVSIRAAVCTDNSVFAKEVFQQLSEKNSMIQFYLCEDEEQVKREVAAGKAECGYSLNDRMLLSMDLEDMKDVIDTFRSPGTIVKGIADELVFSALLSVYSPQKYAEYIADTIHTDEYSRQEVAQTALLEYQTFRDNQTTFRFQFAGDQNLPEQTGQKSFLRLRGMIAVMILAAALCGVAAYQKDRSRQRFLWASHLWAVELSSYLIVITAACMTGLAGLYWTSEWSGFLPESYAMFRYGMSLLVFSFLISRMITNETWILSMVPFAAVGSILAAPVFFDLSKVLPLIGFLKWLTPVSYYLMLFHE